MAGQTWLQLTNTVLARLRESSVTTVSATAYSALIGSLVNEAKRECEDAWDWTRLRASIPLTTVAGTATYTLTALKKRSRILQALNLSYLTEMQQIPMTQMQTLRFLTATPQTGQPQFYNFSGNVAGDAVVTLWPVPLDVYSLSFTAVVPQDDLAADATQLTLQHWPVVLGAWSKAISERGEDGGSNASEVDAMYRGALADLIAQDVGFAPDEVIWNVQ